MPCFRPELGIFKICFKTILVFDWQIPIMYVTNTTDRTCFYISTFLRLGNTGSRIWARSSERLITLLELSVLPWVKQDWVEWERPSKLLREGALRLAEPFRDVSKWSKRWEGQAFVLWRSMRDASGQKDLRSLQPMAVPGQGLTVSPSTGNSLGRGGKRAWSEGGIWRAYHNIHCNTVMV